MSLDVWLKAVRPVEVFQGNCTHNLSAMAKEAGLYGVLWRPEENGITTAGELIQPLQEGLGRLQADPTRFEKHNPPNKWGSYEGFVVFVQEYFAACEANPDALVGVWR